MGMAAAAACGMFEKAGRASKRGREECVRAARNSVGVSNAGAGEEGDFGEF